MKKEDFLEVSAKQDIISSEKKKRHWEIGAVAVCLCLMLGATIETRLSQISDSSAERIGMPAGAWPSDVDPVIASVAVYPADRDVRDVENATLKVVDEETARSVEGLGEYLPAWLPEGISFYYADLYETVMKDGTKYAMLRAVYTTGEVEEDTIIDGETGEAFPQRLVSEFEILFLDHDPGIEEPIYQIKELPKFLSDNWNGNMFYFQYEDIYMSFMPSFSKPTADEILSILLIIGSIEK